MRNQARDLLTHGRIVTTLPKAKELRRYVDRLITLAKRGDLASRRRALAFLQDKVVVRKLFSDLRERYLDRPGGYTRIIKLGERRGDGAMLALIELVEEKLTFKKSKGPSERLKRINEFIERKKRELKGAAEGVPTSTEATNKEEEERQETSEGS